MKNTSTVDYTCDDMSMDASKVLYATVRPHQETVVKDTVKDDQDSSVTSSTAASQQVAMFPMKRCVVIIISVINKEHRTVNSRKKQPVKPKVPKRNTSNKHTHD